MYRVEKSYVDKLVARNPLHFNLLSTSPEFFIDQNQFLFEVSKDGNKWQICYSNIRIHYSNVFEYSDREIQLGETLE